MRKICSAAVWIAVLILIGAGCGKKEETYDAEIYYLNTEGTGLVTQGYDWKSDQTGEQIEEAIEKLKKPEDTVKSTSVIPKDVQITDCSLEENWLDIYFSQEYLLLDKTKEVLLRAAVVKTLTQIDGVDFIQFHAGPEPLKDGHGEVIGYMQNDDFAQNTGAALNSYQREEVTLYYADVEGKKLVKSEVSLRYNSYMTIEKAIIQRLIGGPDEDGMRSAIPSQTKLLGVSIKDGVCYVNLDEGFLEESLAVSPELTVYSLVNSVIAGGNCSQVQISVNGDANVSFRGKIDFESPLGANMEIVEE